MAQTYGFGWIRLEATWRVLCGEPPRDGWRCLRNGQVRLAIKNHKLHTVIKARELPPQMEQALRQAQDTITRQRAKIAQTAAAAEALQVQQRQLMAAEAKALAQAEVLEKTARELRYQLHLQQQGSSVRHFATPPPCGGSGTAVQRGASLPDTTRQAEPVHGDVRAQKRGLTAPPSERVKRVSVERAGTPVGPRGRGRGQGPGRGGGGGGGGRERRGSGGSGGSRVVGMCVLSCWRNVSPPLLL